MTRFFALFLMVLMFSAVIGREALSANDLAVNALRIGTHPDSTRLVVELSKKADFRAFLLQNPSRLVIDLPAFDWRAGASSSSAGGLVGAIRNGVLQPGISRIVVDLKKPSTLKSAFFLPSGPSVPDRVVIDLALAPPDYNPANERMFGSLSSGGPQFQLDQLGTPASASSSGVLKVPANKISVNDDSAPASKPKPQTEDDSAPAPRMNGGKKPLIVIDAGHGGEDPGSPGANGKPEKSVTLAAALELAKELEDTGRYRVHLTRSTDVFIRLPDRVAIARKVGADLFISLHADSIDKAGVSGASIYTLSNTASDAQTAKLAARENQADLIAGVDLSHEDKQVANILIDLAMRDTMNQSKFFANGVVKQANRTGIQLLEKPHRFAGFAVLKAPDIPSVLIEMGFMSNAREVNMLSSPEYRQKLASVIVAGVDSYFNKVQKNGKN